MQIVGLQTTIESGSELKVQVTNWRPLSKEVNILGEKIGFGASWPCGRLRCVAGLVFGLAAYQTVAKCQNVQLSVGSGAVSPGGSVQVGVALTDVGGVQPVSIEWTMSYSGADITSAIVAGSSSAAADAKQVVCNAASGNTVCTLYGLNDTVLAAGTVANVTFAVSGTTSSSSIPIAISGFAAAADGSAIPFSGTGGGLTVSQASGSGTVLTSVACNPGSITGPASTSCAVTLSGPAPANGLPVTVSTNNASVSVPANVLLASGTSTAAFTATVGAVAANETATITAIGAGVAKTFSLNLAPATSTGPVSVWNASAVPAMVTVADANAVELGMKFRSDVAGQITAVRFYKGPHNRGTHVGHLWTTGGTLLGKVTFQNETGSGWQQASFATPISIQANTTYIVSYYAPAGEYCANNNFFTSAVNNPPLHALQSGTDGPNGVYQYGASGFPTQSYQTSNYWVDVVFIPAGGTK